MRENEAKIFGIADRKKYASLTIVKNNYGPTGEVIWFERIPFDGAGLLKHVTLSQPSSAQWTVGLEAKVVGFVRHNPGQYSKTRLRDSQSGKKRDPFKASKADVEQAVETLLAAGHLINRPPTAQERTTFGLGARVTHVLDVPGP